MWTITFNLGRSLDGIQCFPIVVHEETYIQGHIANSYKLMVWNHYLEY